MSIVWPNGTTSTATVAANQTTTLDVTNLFSGFDNTAAEGKTGIAAHITATNPITVYGLNTAPGASDAFVSLPVEALGTRYRALSIPTTGPDDMPARITVVAVQEGLTTVTVTPHSALINHAPGVPYEITLTQGQVYTVTAPAMGADVSGTLVTADKKIDVSGGTDCAMIGGRGACDHAVEVLPPITSWGMSFLLPDSVNSQYRDVYRVLADEDGTVVTLGGTVIATLNAGEVHTFGGAAGSVPLAQLLSADKPVLVIDVPTYGDYSGATGDPSTPLVAPTLQLLNEYTVATPSSGFAVNTLTLIAKSAEIGSVLLDGTAVAVVNFTAIASTDYSVARLRVTPGSYSISAPSNLAVYVEGFNDYNSYAYSGGYASVNLIENPGGTTPSSATIAGDTVVSQTLTAVADPALPLTNPTYVWMREGVAIDGATSVDYVLVPADLGTVISVAISGTNTDSEPETATSPGTSPIAAAPFTTAPVPTISGTTTVDQSLTASAGIWAPTGATLTYQWLRDGQVVTGATDADYTLGVADFDSVLTVQVTGVKSGYVTQTTESLPTEAIAAAAFTTTTAPTITGYAMVNQTLTATVADWTAAATGSTAGYITESTVSAASAAVAPIPVNSTPAQTLTADKGGLITVSGYGFIPGESVEVWLHSTPVLLGSLIAAADGTVTGAFALPAGTITGVHHIVLTGLQSGSVTSLQITVVAPAALASSLAKTGVDLSLTSWLALLLAISGLGLVLVRRRHAQARYAFPGLVEGRNTDRNGCCHPRYRAGGSIRCRGG